MACPDCGINVPKLEPRSFSFNSTYGACPECNGLGSIYDFDPAKIIVDWSKPLLEGGWGRVGGSQYLGRLSISRRTNTRSILRRPFEAAHRGAAELLPLRPRTRRRPRTGFHGILKWLRQSLDESPVPTATANG